MVVRRGDVVAGVELSLPTSSSRAVVQEIAIPPPEFANYSVISPFSKMVIEKGLVGDDLIGLFADSDTSTLPRLPSSERPESEAKS